MNKGIKEINIDDKEKNSKIDRERNKSESLVGKKDIFKILREIIMVIHVLKIIIHLINKL